MDSKAKQRLKEEMRILGAIGNCPPECADCAAFCEEGRLGVPCQGSFPEICEYKSNYVEDEEE